MVLFNSSQPVTTPELNEILHHEKVNVSKTYFNKYNELFLLCNSEEDLDALFSATCISKLYTVGCKPVLPPDLKAKRSVILLNSGEVIKRYLIRKKKILKLKSSSRMFVLECGIFSSMIVRKTRLHLRTNTWSHRCWSCEIRDQGSRIS